MSINRNWLIEREKYEKYIISEEWYNMKLDLIGIRGCKCEKCKLNFKPNRLQLHHLNYWRLYNEESQDLMLLCATCHKKEHENLKKLKTKEIEINKKYNNKLKKLKNKRKDRIERRFKRGYYKTYDTYLQALKAAEKQK